MSRRSVALSITTSDHTNHEHLPGSVLGKARHEDRVVGAIPTGRGINPDVASICPFEDALTASKQVRARVGVLSSVDGPDEAASLFHRTVVGMCRRGELLRDTSVRQPFSVQSACGCPYPDWKSLKQAAGI